MTQLGEVIEDVASAPARYDTTRDMKTIKTRQGMIPYLGVKGRVAWLRAEHPDAAITTEKVDGGIEAGWVEFKCTITVASTDAIATGHASETHQDFPDFYEKAETKAVGRACALLGYGTEGARDLDDGEPLDGAATSKAERASRRMEPAERERVDAQHQRNTQPAPSEPAHDPATAATERHGPGAGGNRGEVRGEGGARAGRGRLRGHRGERQHGPQSGGQRRGGGPQPRRHSNGGGDPQRADGAPGTGGGAMTIGKVIHRYQGHFCWRWGPVQVNRIGAERPNMIEVTFATRRHVYSVVRIRGLRFAIGRETATE